MQISTRRLLAVKACRLSAFYVYAFKPMYLYRLYKLFHVFCSVHTAVDVSFSWWKRAFHSLEVLQYFLSGLNNSPMRATIWQLELIWVGREFFFLHMQKGLCHRLKHSFEFEWLFPLITLPQSSPLGTLFGGHVCDGRVFTQPGQSFAAYKITFCMHGVPAVLNVWRQSLNFSLESNQFVGRKSIVSRWNKDSPFPLWKRRGEQAVPSVPVRMLLPSAVGEQLLAQ